MQFVEGHGGGGTAEGDASALGREDGSVEVLLGRSEFPSDRPGATYVGDIPAILLVEEYIVRSCIFQSVKILADILHPRLRVQAPRSW